MKALLQLLLLTITLPLFAQSPESIEAWQEQVSQSDFSGTVIAAHKGELIYQQQFGIANREQNTPFSPGTVFDIGSISKQFTAAAILKLAEQQKLSVDDPITKYFEGVPKDKQAITIHHLMFHASGLPQGFGLYEKIDKAAFVKQAMKVKLDFVPGERYQYSNTGYSLLGVIIEEVVGQGYETFILDNIVKPAGLYQTGYRLVERQAENLAVAYGRDPNPLQRLFSMQAKSRSVGHSLQHQYDDPGPRWYMQGGGGFLSTTQDMFKWYLTLRTGAILQTDSWQQVFTPHVAENQEATSHYGYGWSIGEDKKGNKRIAHNGSNGYTFADFKYYPELDVLVFYATNNRDDSPEALMSQLDAIIINQVTTEAPSAKD